MILIDGYDKRTKYAVRPMSSSEVKALTSGDTVKFLANDGTLRNIKVNGAVRTWKRDPNRVEVPVKYGMYEYATLSLTEATNRLMVVIEEVK